MSWAPNAPYDDDEERFREPFFPLFVPWNVLTLKQGSRSAHDISAGDLTPGLLREAFRSNENMRSPDSNNFTLRMLLLFLSTNYNVNNESLLMLALNAQCILRACD